MARHFRALFEPYPNLRRFVTLYHPDLQGPIDCAEILWGSDIFYAVADSPDLVHQLLDVVTEIYTVDRGIRLIGLARAAAETAVARGRDLRGLVHCP